MRYTNLHKLQDLAFPLSETGCMEFTGCLDGCGYGVVRFGRGSMWRAHRYSYLFHKGPVDGLEVLHMCDNPPCVNPDHLITGTHAENMADAARKGRMASCAGALNPNSKLSAEDVLGILELRRQGYSQRAIARRFSVGRTTVIHVLSGSTWSHVTDGLL